MRKSRLMRRIFNISPALTKYSYDWGASIVVIHISKMDHGNSNSLSKKMATLLALLSGK